MMFMMDDDYLETHSFIPKENAMAYITNIRNQD